MVFDVLQISRFTLGFVWIYHGLVPKLLWIDPTEMLMTGSLGFDPQTSYWITKSAGLGEVLFGVALIVFYQRLALIWLNLGLLFGLLVFAVVFTPSVLSGAFNPVTTNIMAMVISMILIQQISSSAGNTKPRNLSKPT